MSPITSAGHTRAITSNAYAAGTPSELERAFDEWRREYADLGDSHTSAKNRLENISFNMEELHDVLLKNASSMHHSQCEGFVAAAYNACQENVLVYDLDVPLDFLGGYLPRDKLFINCGTVGNWSGYGCSGIIVNAGVAGSFFGNIRSGGIGISLHPPESYESFLSHGGMLVAHNEITGPLRAYLEELVSLCKESPKTLHSRHGPEILSAIRANIVQRAPEVRYHEGVCTGGNR